MPDSEIKLYNQKLLSIEENEICNILSETINKYLKNSIGKIWHSHPVWFINENPIVGYSKQKNGIRLMFWSGADFEDDKLKIKGKKFKDASILYNEASNVKLSDLKKWIKKSEQIQWDYKNLIKRKGKLERIIFV